MPALSRLPARRYHPRVRSLVLTALATIALVVPGADAAARPRTTRPPVYDLIVGGEHEYVVGRGDTLWSITGHFTMNRALLEAWNALPNPDALRPGMRLRVSDRHIVPRRHPDGIVIDVAVRTLYWFEGGRLKARFPVGVGR